MNDENREVAIRAAIVDILILTGDKAILSSVFEILQKTNIENMKTYVITQVSSILESSDPEQKG